MREAPVERGLNQSFLSRFVRPILFAALLLTLGAIGAACGGDGALSLEEYFREVEQLRGDVVRQSERLQDGFDRAINLADSEEATVQAFRDFFTDASAIFAEFVTDIDALEPPDAVADAHREAVEAFEDSQVAISNFSARLNQVESEAELDGLFETFDSEPAFDRFEEACLALQEIADDNAIAVDLACGDE